MFAYNFLFPASGKRLIMRKEKSLKDGKVLFRKEICGWKSH